MVDVIYRPPGAPAHTGRHVVVVVHRDHMGLEKAYFYDSDERDWGGSGPFDHRRDECIERAKTFANDRGIKTVIVRADG